MILAVVLGLVAGVLGFLPLLGGLQLVKRATSTSNIGQAGGALLGIFGSFVFLAITLVVCIVVARDMIMPFTIAEALALSCVAIVYGVQRLVRK